MLQYFLFICIVIVTTYSYYFHFFRKNGPKMMIAYDGNKHPRYFERKFMNENADLFVFKNRPYHSKRIHFISNDNELKYFMGSHYKHLLIVRSLEYHIPVFYDTNFGINYTHNNHTVALLWHKTMSHTLENIKV